MDLIFEGAVALCTLLSVIATATYYRHEMRYARLFAYVIGEGIFVCNSARHPVMVRYIIAERGTLFTFWEKDSAYQLVPRCSGETRTREDELVLPDERKRLDYALCLNGEPCEAVAVVKNVRPFSPELVDIVLRPLVKDRHDEKNGEAGNADA